ncbi:MAG: hypothetical protein OEO77_02660 [Acidimicrobiia bacterium]|nr:hypothetical protein [Acidimicrobiia bacterium]
MDPVADHVLDTIANISASLIGLFLVGMIFYIQTGFDRVERSRDHVEPYFRAATLITFISLAIPLGVSLSLLTLPIAWSRLLYLILVAALIAADVSTINAVRACVRATGLNLLSMMEFVGTVMVIVIAGLPVTTGALHPEREDLVPALLISLGVGFLSTCVLVLTLFDIARLERADLPQDVDQKASRGLGTAESAMTGQMGCPITHQDGPESSTDGLKAANGTGH